VGQEEMERSPIAAEQREIERCQRGSRGLKGRGKRRKEGKLDQESAQERTTSCLNGGEGSRLWEGARKWGLT